MAEASDQKGILLQNLQDAGCDTGTISECISLADKKQEARLLRLLSHHKSILLDAVHKNQERIDCLDFLVYQIKHGMLLKNEEDFL